MPAASSTTPLIPAVASTDGPEPTDCARSARWPSAARSEEHTSELQSQSNLVCRLLLEKKRPRDPSELDLLLALTAGETHPPSRASYHPANSIALLALENVTRRFAGIVALAVVSLPPGQ